MKALVSRMTILTITSQKGGVGKTTVSVNLAYALARRGWSVLLADTDPQGSVGLSLSEKARKCQGIYDILNTGMPPEGLVLSTRLPELKILPCGQVTDLFQPVSLDVDAIDALRRCLSSLARSGYDLVIFDTPAGLGGTTGDVLKVTDFVVIPQQAEPLGMRSIPQMLHGIHQLRQSGAKLDVAGILMTMVQHEVRESADVIRELRALLPARLMLDTILPRDPTYLRASAAGVPVSLLYNQPPAAAHVFDQLAAELEPRLRLQRPAPQAAHEYTRLMD
jgi:chromosome partitioning protein